MLPFHTAGFGYRWGAPSPEVMPGIRNAVSLARVVLNAFLSQPVVSLVGLIAHAGAQAYLSTRALFPTHKLDGAR